jgi:hypothetical protein
MEAAMEGDTTANRLMEEFNRQRNTEETSQEQE